MVITLDKLKKLCDNYDECMGSWPESKFEGEAVYEWVINKLKLEEIKNDF